MNNLHLSPPRAFVSSNPQDLSQRSVQTKSNQKEILTQQQKETKTKQQNTERDSSNVIMYA